MMKCPVCRGSKKVDGLGYMSHKCKRCDGAGEIPEPIFNVSELIASAIDVESAHEKEPVVEAPKTKKKMKIGLRNTDNV